MLSTHRRNRRCASLLSVDPPPRFVHVMGDRKTARYVGPGDHDNDVGTVIGNGASSQ